MKHAPCRQLAGIVVGLACLSISSLPEPALPSLWASPPRELKLTNGMTLVYQQDGSSPMTVVQILIRGGQSAENIGKEGLSYLVTRLTLEIPDLQTLQKLMGQATRIMMFNQSDYSMISLCCLSDNLEESLKVTTGILFDPLLSSLRIERNKEQMDFLRDKDADDPESTAHLAQLESLFPGHPYGVSVYGTENSLQAVRKSDIDDFYRRAFCSGNMTLIVISDLDMGVVSGLAETYFRKAPEGPALEIAVRPTAPISSPERRREVIKDVQQSLVSMAFPLPAVSAKNTALFTLLECLLGKGVGSRLWPLRTEQKLAYNVNARVSLMRDGGMLEAYLETEDSKREEAEDALARVIDRLRIEGLTSEELAVTKTYAKADFLRANETKQARTQTFAEFLGLGLGTGYLNDFFAEIEAVTVEEMNSALADVLDAELGFRVVVGPQKIPD